MKKLHLLLLSVLSGLLFTISWPVNGIPLFIFIAFVPLLIIEGEILDHPQKYGCCAIFKFIYPAFFIWNLLTTWWVGYSTLFGVVMAVVLNSAFMYFTFFLFHRSRRWLPSKNNALWTLLFFWITFEWLHLDWDLSWPWLNIGNVFGSWHKWVQWYSVTGVFGGAVWILMINILIYRIYISIAQKSAQAVIVRQSVIVLVLFLAPIVLSYVMYNNYEEPAEKAEIVVIQTDNDPYTEQYTLTSEEVTDNFLELAEPLVTDQTKFVVCPESVLYDDIWEHQFDRSKPIRKIKTFIQKFPQLSFVVGASTSKHYPDGMTGSPTVRTHIRANGDSIFYDNFNTALLIKNGSAVETYHKSKLVPGPEKMPFHSLLKPFQHFAFDLGGTVGSLGSDPERTSFCASEPSICTGPIICYESIYGEFVTEYVQKGANLLFVITNDGWWSDSPGRLQHLLFSKLRCIENRRSMARSANTGVSAFINQKGDILLDGGINQAKALKYELSINNEKSWYSVHGDYIARIAAFISVLLLLYTLSEYLRTKGRRHRKV